MKLETARRRVARGAALMDRDHPRWYTDRRLDHLAMSNEYWCVLGIVEGNYYGALRGRFPYSLPRAVAWAIRHGFYEWWRPRDRYVALEQAWGEAIAARRTHDRLGVVAEFILAA